MLSLPNVLSIFRGVLGLLIPFFLLRSDFPSHLIAFFFFIIGAWTDYLDGVIARRHNLITDFGKIVDPTTDKILILTPLAGFAYLGFFSIWWVVPIFIREIVVTFCRIGFLLGGKAVAAERLGKVKLGFQVAAVCAAFFYLFVLDFQLTAPFETIFQVFMYVLFGVALILTLASGLSFIRLNAGLLVSAHFAKYTLALGVGFFPFAPGTWGSLVGLILAGLTHWNPALFGGVFGFLLLLGLKAFQGIDRWETKDPAYVVIDEALGMMVSVAFLPLNPVTALCGFLLFRFFDIVKPFPLRRLEKIPGYWGIVLDDLGAGVYSWLTLFMLIRLSS